MYETITVQELPNRASNAYHAGDCGIPETPNTFFAVMYFTAGEWNNGHETTDEAEATATLAQYRRMRGESETTKIVLVVAKQVEPVIEEPAQSEPVEEVQEVVEPAEASTDEQPEVSESGKFEVEVSAVGKPFTAYRGNSLETAKATVAAHTGKCLRVQTRVHLSGGSFWVYPGKRANGLAWDSHEQWLADLHAGAFDRAYARDHINDLVLQGKHEEAKNEANWFQERGINV